MRVCVRCGRVAGACAVAAGLFEGKGTLTMVDGGVYEGYFVRGLREGKGSYRWPDGDHYKGQYKEGVREGVGRFTYADGSK